MVSTPSTSTTTGRLTISPVRRMPTLGCEMIAAPTKLPLRPGLLMVKVAPARSSGEVFPSRALAATSSMPARGPSP
jgi:hypothetical protein